MTKTDTRTAAELEQDILDGKNVTAEQLAAARARDDHQALLAEHQRRTAEHQAAQQRALAIAELRTRIAGIAGRTEELDALARTAADAVTAFAAALTAHGDAVTSLAREARTLGVRRYGAGQVDLGDDGVGIRNDVGGVGKTELRVEVEDGQRVLAEPAHDSVLADLISELATIADVSRHTTIRRNATIGTTAQRINTLDRIHRATPRIEVVMLTGGNRGKTVELAPLAAQKLVDIGTARYTTAADADEPDTAA